MGKDNYRLKKGREDLLFCKKRMFYFIFALMLFVVAVKSSLCSTYYIKNNGDDNATGLSDNHAWKTIAKVNRTKFSNGDVLLFRRGDVFSDAQLCLTGVANLTIADYGSGAKPYFNGNANRPLWIHDLRNLIIKNIDISGEEWTYGKSENLRIDRVENIQLNGIYGDGFRGIKHNMGKTAVSITQCSGTIEIKNCELVNWGPENLPKKTKDFMGIALIKIQYGSYSIHNNKIHNVNADCVHLYHCSANGRVFDNILSNAGEDSIDIKGSKNVKVYNNKFFRTSSFTGEGGSGSGGIPTYMVVHGAGGENSANIIIENNTFLNGDCAAIKIDKTYGTTISGNKMIKTESAVYIGNKSYNTIIFNNMIRDPVYRIGYKGMDSGCIYENNSSPGTKIYNNIIYNDNGSCKQLIAIACCNGTKIFNNKVYNKYGGKNDFSLYFWPCGVEPYVSGNSWYNVPDANVIKFRSRIYKQNMQNQWQTSHPGDMFFLYAVK